MSLPKYSEETETGELGVRLVEAAVHDELGWIFRVKRKADVGIDGEIELVNERREATGRLISVQIKCGSSYQPKSKRKEFVYRGDLDHLEYWLGHSLPVIVVLCDPITKHCHWVEVTASTAIRLKNGWKLTLPSQNLLNSGAKSRLEQIANRVQVEDFLEPAVRTWLYEKYFKRIEICSVFELPRDFHWYRFLAKIDGEDTVMIHYLYARYAYFSAEELNIALGYQEYNYKVCTCRRLMLCLVAQDKCAFQFTPEFHAELAATRDVELVRLLLSAPPFFEVRELTSADDVVDEYIRGEPQIYSPWK